MLAARFYDGRELTMLQLEVKDLLTDLLRFYGRRNSIILNNLRSSEIRSPSPSPVITASYIVTSYAPEINFMSSLMYYICSLSADFDQAEPRIISTLGQSFCGLCIPLQSQKHRFSIKLKVLGICLLYSSLAYLKERALTIMQSSYEIYSILIAPEEGDLHPRVIDSSISRSSSPPRPTSLGTVIWNAIVASVPSLGGPDHLQRLESLKTLIQDVHLFLFFRYGRLPL
jgi:hypothetical protein